MAYSSSQGASALHFDIAVVGRGPIGASAALALQQADVRVAWVGRDAVSSIALGVWDSRIYALSDAARQLLARLKVWEALARERIAPVYDMRVFPRATLDQTRHDELHFAAYEARTEALAWIVEGTNLTSTLKRAIGFSSVQTIEANLVALERSDERAVVLKLDDGLELRAKLVVGADGAGSVTREQVGIVSTSYDYPQTAVVANFECTAPHADSAWQWFGAHGVLALLPLPGRYCSMVWSAPHARVGGARHGAFGSGAWTIAGAIGSEIVPVAPAQGRSHSAAAHRPGRRCSPCDSSTGRAGHEPWFC
jgi:2-polyprenylphenol 6-hydroxylase